MDSISQKEAKQKKIICPNHKKPVQFLNTNIDLSKNERVLKCESCLSQELSANYSLQLATNPHIPLDDIAILDDPFELDSWFFQFDKNKFYPLLDSQEEEEQGDFKTELNQFIKTLRSQINNKIDQFQEEILKRYQEIELNQQKIISYSQKMSHYSEIKTIILNSSNYETTVKQLNDQIEILKSQKPNVDKNLTTLIENFNFYSTYLCLNNLKYIETILDDVFTNYQNLISRKVLDMAEQDNDRIKDITENPNFKDNIYIGYQIKCISKKQLKNTDLICYYYVEDD